MLPDSQHDTPKEAKKEPHCPRFLRKRVHSFRGTSRSRLHPRLRHPVFSVGSSQERSSGRGETDFEKILKNLSRSGFLLINEQHPATDMLCAPGEEFYDEATLTALRNSCFGKEWIDEGMRSTLQKRTIVPENSRITPDFFRKL
jgi:hypothetical protein